MTEEELTQIIRNNFDEQVVSALRKRGLSKLDLAEEFNVPKSYINTATVEYSKAERFVKLRAKIRRFLDIQMMKYELVEVDQKEKIGV